MSWKAPGKCRVGANAFLSLIRAVSRFILSVSSSLSLSRERSRVLEGVSGGTIKGRGAQGIEFADPLPHSSETKSRHVTSRNWLYDPPRGASCGEAPSLELQGGT